LTEEDPMKCVQRIATLALLLIAAGSYAARPTSIVFETHGETNDGRPYSQFTVRCNDGRSVELKAWDGLSKWCVGENGTDQCQKKQISAAKTACMGS
jgi:hypothetical protein